jgi:hypothetical protein
MDNKFKNFIYKWMDENCGDITIVDGTVIFYNKKTLDSYYYSSLLDTTFGDYKFCKLLSEVKISSLDITYRMVDNWLVDRGKRYLKTYGDKNKTIKIKYKEIG